MERKTKMYTCDICKDKTAVIEPCRACERDLCVGCQIEVNGNISCPNDIAKFWTKEDGIEYEHEQRRS